MKYLGRITGVLIVIGNSLIWIAHQGIVHYRHEVGLFEVIFTIFSISLGYWFGKTYDRSKFQKNEIQKSHKKLEYLTYRDGLTNISNRRSFDNFLLHEWEKALASITPIALILFDIDYFKEYNDTYGHLSGDEILKRIATNVDQLVQTPKNMVARFGGEEFAVILPETNLHKAYELAEEIRFGIGHLNIPHSKSKKNVVTVSVGVTYIIPKPSTSIVDFINSADIGLYHSKQKGRNVVTVYPFNESLPSSE